jgi:hypothetical protein
VFGAFTPQQAEESALSPDSVRDAQKNRRASPLVPQCAKKSPAKEQLVLCLAIKKRLNCDNHDVANKKALLFNGSPDGTQRSSANDAG